MPVYAGPPGISRGQAPATPRALLSPRCIAVSTPFLHVDTAPNFLNGRRGARQASSDFWLRLTVQIVGELAIRRSRDRFSGDFDAREWCIYRLHSKAKVLELG